MYKASKWPCSPFSNSSILQNWFWKRKFVLWPTSLRKFLERSADGCPCIKSKLSYIIRPFNGGWLTTWFKMIFESVIKLNGQAGSLGPPIAKMWGCKTINNCLQSWISNRIFLVQPDLRFSPQNVILWWEIRPSKSSLLGVVWCSSLFRPVDLLEHPTSLLLPEFS